MIVYRMTDVYSKHIEKGKEKKGRRKRRRRKKKRRRRKKKRKKRRVYFEMADEVT